MYTILICDDDKDIVSALDIYLTSEGYRTIKAYNGREAIRAVEQNEIHLILMDIMMPEMSGITTLKELQKDESFTTPVIAVTADAISGAEEKYLENGFCDYISKPFTKEQIEKKLIKIFDEQEKNNNNSIEIL